MGHFIYALLNILNQMSPYILLGFFLAGLMHAFIKPSTMTRHLSGHGYKPVLKAALVGIPLPLCSCGVLPTAVAMHRQGASKGATTSFLIATPQTGVDSIAATYAILGLPFAVIRPIAALVGSFFGGLAVDRACRRDDSAVLTATEHIEPDTDRGTPPRSFGYKLAEAVRYGMIDMVGSVGKWLVIGLIVAAIITVAVPDSLFVSLAEYPILAMLLMVAVAVPMYVCATGSIPIALSLMLKGLSPGVAFVLLMAGPAANFASIMVLRKSLGHTATAVYVLSVVVTALTFGLLIDYLLPASWFTPTLSATATANCHMHWALFPTFCSALLTVLLIAAFVRSRITRRRFTSCGCEPASCACTDIVTDTTNQSDNTYLTAVYKVNGMACRHCKSTVEKAIAAVDGVEEVNVDLSTGRVRVNGRKFDSKAIEKAVSNAGFDFVGEE